MRFPRIRSALVAGTALALVAASSVASAAPQPQIGNGFVDAFPSAPAPAPAQPFDWKQRALDYDAFVYDWNKTSQYPTIVLDDTSYNMDGDTYSLPAYYGDLRVEEADGKQEALNQIASVVGATLAGVNKANQNGRNYVDMQRTFFWDNLGDGGVALNMPSDGDGGQRGGQSWWYATTANVLYYMLGDQYPTAAEMPAMLRGIADSYVQAIDVIDGNNGPANFDGQGFNFQTKQVVGGINQGGDAAAGTATILLWAYDRFGDAKYLAGAKKAMDYLETKAENLNYEILPNLSPYIAARMNAEYGTSYDVGRLFEQLLAGSAPRPGWGTIEGSWGSYNVSGLQGSRNDGDGYAFAMNSFAATLFAATAKYDPRYANFVGRFLLNTDNASRFFYPDQMPAGNQYYGNTYRTAPEHVIAYEGLRKVGAVDAGQSGKNPNATGDPERFWQNFGISDRTTNLGLYGSSWVGFMGAVIERTDVPGINRLDLNELDFHNDDNARPTYLYYNPTSSPVNVSIPVTSATDLYDAVADQVIKKNVSSNQTITIPAQSSRILVYAPANATYSRVGGDTLAKVGTATYTVGYQTGPADLAAGKAVTATSTLNGNVASALTDRDPNTRWEGQTSDQTVTVDLGKTELVTRTILRWETASAKNFSVQVSTDNTNWSTVYSTTSGPGGAQDIAFAPVDARYVRVHMTERNTQWAYSMWDLEVYQDDLALGRPVTASSTVNGNEPRFVTDGVGTTRWESQTSDLQWVTVDLGSAKTVSRAVIDWETASAKAYTIQVSTNNQSWTTVHTATNAPGGSPNVQNVAFTPINARYVRVDMTQRNTGWAYSIWGLQVYQDNIAYRQPTIVTSTLGFNRASNLTDGVASTRWESAQQDPQGAVVDFGTSRPVGAVVVRWETASAKDYLVQTSTDGNNWTTRATVTNSPGGVRTHAFTPVNANFVRIWMTSRNTPYAYSIFELEAYPS